MATGLIGKKVGMTRVFTDNGEQVSVTLVELGPCTVVGTRTLAKDGYTAVRLGLGERKERHTNMPMAGEAKAAGLKAAPRKIKEFRVSAEELANYTVGQLITVDIFAKDQWVDVTGTSKGRGFAGVFKRHHMAGAVDGHGAHEYFRHGGAVGQRKTPGRVFKNKRMPGHMGVEKCTIQKLKVINVDRENNLVLLKGSVPGPTNGAVSLKATVKHVKVPVIVEAPLKGKKK